MKTIRNKTQKPIRIALPGGKILHLGPAKRGQVPDQATERPSFQKLVHAGEIEVVGEGEATGPTEAGGTPVHEATHGHPPTTVVQPKGNR